ncbi:AraC family transcriptional regulator [Eisenbergiella sp.]
MIEILNGTHETVAYREMKGIKVFLNTDPEDFPLHWHTALELIMPVRNDYTVRTNGETIHVVPGDILLIPPGELHSLFAPPEGERLFMQFDYSLLCSLTGMDSLLHTLRPYRLIKACEQGGLTKTLREYLEEIKKEYTSEDPYREPSVYSLFLRFFVALGRSDMAEGNKFPDISPSKQQEYIEKFMSICTYINDHCTEDLSIEKLAARAGFSKYHFSRLFKQFTGVSCYEYLISRRIAYAERLLLTPNLSITEVAMQSGFNSLSTFNRIFKTAKNCTPSSYKSLNRGTRLDTAGSPD